MANYSKYTNSTPVLICTPYPCAPISTTRLAGRRPDFVADVPMRERLTLSTQFDDTKRSLVMHKSRFR
jgi:hypothetical protein